MKTKVLIHNYWYVNNYGAVLTAYALYKVLKEMDYEPYLVDLSSYRQNKIYLFNKFINKYCPNVTKNLRDENAIYLTGSDQVFRPKLGNNLDKFLLNYAPINCKKVACSASFGATKEEFKKEVHQSQLDEIQTALNSFDFISVRELSGISLVKDLFGLNAEQIIDPVFMLDKTQWEMLELPEDNKDKIISYIFDKNEEQDNAINALAKRYNAEVFELNRSKVSIENWLGTIKNCKMLVTNSFHGMCFAIILNRPFIWMINEKEGADRANSILELLNIQNGVVTPDKIVKKNIDFNFDWDRINKKIMQEATRGKDLLKNGLEIPLFKTEEKRTAKIKFLEKRVLELEEECNIRTQLNRYLWNTWLTVFYNLPKPIRNIIRFLRGKNG